MMDIGNPADNQETDNRTKLEIECQRWILGKLKSVYGSDKDENLYQALKADAPELSKYFESKNGQFDASKMSRFRSGDKNLRHDEKKHFVTFLCKMSEKKQVIDFSDNASKYYINAYKTKPYYNSLKEFFYKSLFNELYIKIAASEMDNPLDFFIKRYRLEDRIIEFLISTPSTLFAVIEGKSSKYGTSNQLKGKGNTNGFFLYDKAFNEEYNVALKNVNRIVLGHTPSPYGDSLALLLELGRFKRLAQHLRIKEEITLIGPDWMKLNHIVSLFIEKIDQTDHLINVNTNFRKKLYDRINVRYDEKFIRDIEHDAEKRVLETAKEYGIYKCLIERELKDQYTIKDLFNIYDQENASDQLKTCFKPDGLLGLTIVEKKKNLKFLKAVYDHFSDTISERIISYILLQRFLQHSWKNCLKIGVRSEKKFDLAFHELNIMEKLNKPLSALYFDHYYFEKKNDHYLDLIPYYFPSGSILSLYKDENKVIDVYKKHAIMLTDHQSNREKIKSMIYNLPKNQLAVQYADLLSFASFFCTNDGKKNIYESLKEIHCEFADSWAIYNGEKSQSELKKLKKFIFSVWHMNSTLPYFFYPYILTCENYWHEFKEKLINGYQKLILIVLPEVTELNAEEQLE